jgi:predicted amidohydrolase
MIGDLETNLAMSTKAIRSAVEAGAKVIVLPELATSGYVFESPAEAETLAIGLTDPAIERWRAELADSDAVLVAGFCERGPDGVLFNSAVVLDAGGVRAVYRKTHLWDEERSAFTPGSEPPPVVDTPHGRIGVLICYDLEFPEMPRSLALQGADLIAVPTNWPLLERPPGEHAPEVIAAMAAARASRVFVVCCDRTGEERGVQFTAGTSIIDHDGWIRAETSDAGLLVADLPLELARDKRIGTQNDVLADRRPDLYGGPAS